MDLRDIKVVNKLGGTVDDSEMVDGMIFDHKPSKVSLCWFAITCGGNCSWLDSSCLPLCSHLCSPALLSQELAPTLHGCQ